jgi:hypothetical protein
MDPKQIEGNPFALAEVGAHFRPIATMPIIAKAEARLSANLCDAGGEKGYLDYPTLTT